MLLYHCSAVVLVSFVPIAFAFLAMSLYCKVLKGEKNPTNFKDILSKIVKRKPPNSSDSPTFSHNQESPL